MTTSGHRGPEAPAPAANIEMPCIRCGKCADACPVQLRPQQLLLHLRNEDFKAAEAEQLFSCNECGYCDLVCPSQIPLVQTFKDGKNDIREKAAQLAAADAARERFGARQRRLEREAVETAARQSERKAQVASPDAVAAALERAKARRLAQGKDSGS